MTKEEIIEFCEMKAELEAENEDIYEAIIKELEQEPKTAHWILLDECSNSGYYCSKCHKKVIKEGWSNTVKKVKYCPNCGARMTESEG